MRFGLWLRPAAPSDGSRLSAVPSPHGGVIAHVDQHAGIAGEGDLAHSGHAARIVQGGHVGTLGIAGIQLPHIHLALLIAQGNHLLPRIEAESHEPDLALVVLELRDDRAGGVARLHLLEALMELSRLPADNGIFAGLGEHKVAKPLHTVHIVPVYIPRRKVGEVLGHRGEWQS